jgi:4-hydroxyacetophenone monooxygenase
MPDNDGVELPIDELGARLDAADPLALLLTTVHHTGDLELLREQWRPDRTIGVAEHVYAPQTQAQIRAACVSALEHTRAQPDRPEYDLLERIVAWSMGRECASYTPLLADGLSFGPEDDPGRPRWQRSAMAPDRDFRVAVIGAGASGLLLAHRLRQAGVPVTVLEKNPDVGGTWYDNTYPGCRVDLPSRTYRYSCYPGHWNEHYSTQPTMLEYLRAFARDHRLYEDIEFDSEVLSSQWDESRAKWVLRIRTGDAVRELLADVQVSAVGQLNQPRLPDITGAATFAGSAFHSSRWDPSVDLRGKRVGVIGTGASAVQLVPEIARSAAEVSVFGRTMPWLVPTPKLRVPFSEDERWLLDHFPHYAAWYRATEFLTTIEGNLDLVTVDPEYPPTERAVSAVNAQLGSMMRQWIDLQTGDAPQLRSVLDPGGPLGAKRWIADDGSWITTLKQPHVRLVREPIKEVSVSGVTCAGDETYDLDVLIYATGFRAAEFLLQMEVAGRGGMDLRQHWSGDDASAYLGACVPGFPNFFCVYGPNTGIVVHGVSVFFMSECAVRYVVDAIRLLLESGSVSLEIRETTAHTYQRRIDEASRRLAWGFSGVNSWYKNSVGRSTQNWPLATWEYWQRTRAADPADFVITPLATPGPAAAHGQRPDGSSGRP